MSDRPIERKPSDRPSPLATVMEGFVFGLAIVVTVSQLPKTVVSFKDDWITVFGEGETL
jgi:hypothetical protein